MTDEDRVRLLHMLDASRKAVALVYDTSLEQYTAEDSFVLRAATERFMEIVGEAAHHVSDEFKSRNPKIPWVQISGMRNHLVHGYMNTDNEVVWKAVVEDAPPLIAQLDRLVESQS